MTVSPPRALGGRHRRFGPVGPVYEIVAVGDTLPDGDTRIRIRVVESGEEADYCFSRALEDPAED